MDGRNPEGLIAAVVCLAGILAGELIARLVKSLFGL
jgi:hypothetical protein